MEMELRAEEIRTRRPPLESSLACQLARYVWHLEINGWKADVRRRVGDRGSPRYNCGKLDREQFVVFSDGAGHRF